MRKKVLTLASFCYGLLVISFGIYGYYKKLSIASLVSGLLFGGLITIASILFGKNKKRSDLFLQISSLLLTFVFSYRYFASGKLLPAVFALLGAILSLFLSQWKKKAPSLS